MTPPSRILLLGGTSDARELARMLVDRPEFVVVSSLAGRVENPLLPAGEVRSGGFGGVDGLREWLRQNHMDLVVDATHPFAATMSDHAASACSEENVPLVTLARPPWTAVSGDRWQSVETVADAANALTELPRPSTVFLTTGRQEVAAFAGISKHRFVIRAIDPPDGPMPDASTVLLSRGPFELEDELALMTDQSVDVLVTKNSGGDMTRAKLDAARQLGLPVIMVERPASRHGGTEVPTAADVLDHLIRTAAR